VTSQVKATAGLRYFSYNSNSVTQVSGVSANGTSAPLLSNAANSGVTPKFNLSFQPTDDLNLYATISKGFRPGGPKLADPRAALHRRPDPVRTGQRVELRGR